MKKKRSKKSSAPITAALHVGADRAAVEAVAEMILKVLATPAGDAVKMAAIMAIKDGGAVNNASICNNTFTVGR